MTFGRQSIPTVLIRPGKKERLSLRIVILFVFEGHSIETNEQVAIKVIDKTRFSDQEEKIHREVDILHEITHPGVIKLHAMFDTPGKVWKKRIF